MNETLKKNGKDSLFTHYTHPPEFGKKPVVFPSLAEKYTRYFDEYMVLADSAGLTGYYTVDGKKVIRHGPYARFNCEENSMGAYIEIQGTNGLNGFYFKGKIVEPIYEFFVPGKIGYRSLFSCYLPNKEKEYRDGAKLLSKQEVAYMEELDARRIQSENILSWDPFEVVKHVKSGSASDLLAYGKRCGSNFSNTKDKEGTQYKITCTFRKGVESFSDSRSGLAITYKFQDSEEKRQNMERIKREGYAPKEISPASITMTKEGVDITLFTSGNTWIISRATGPGMTQAQLDSAASVFRANADELGKKVDAMKKSQEELKKSEENLKKAAEEYRKSKQPGPSSK